MYITKNTMDLSTHNKELNHKERQAYLKLLGEKKRKALTERLSSIEMDINNITNETLLVERLREITARENQTRRQQRQAQYEAIVKENAKHARFTPTETKVEDVRVCPACDKQFIRGSIFCCKFCRVYANSRIIGESAEQFKKRKGEVWLDKYAKEEKKTKEPKLKSFLI